MGIFLDRIDGLLEQDLQQQQLKLVDLEHSSSLHSSDVLSLLFYLVLHANLPDRDLLAILFAPSVQHWLILQATCVSDWQLVPVDLDPQLSYWKLLPQHIVEHCKSQHHNFVLHFDVYEAASDRVPYRVSSSSPEE